jgi:HrpA-like RNA helicase
MSEITRAPSMIESSFSHSDLNATATTAASEFDIKFTSNNHRSDLPIFKYRNEIMRQINDSPVVIITGQTGKLTKNNCHVC